MIHSGAEQHTAVIAGPRHPNGLQHYQRVTDFGSVWTEPTFDVVTCNRFKGLAVLDFMVTPDEARILHGA